MHPIHNYKMREPFKTIQCGFELVIDYDLGNNCLPVSVFAFVDRVSYYTDGCKVDFVSCRQSLRLATPCQKSTFLTIVLC